MILHSEYCCILCWKCHERARKCYVLGSTNCQEQLRKCHKKPAKCHEQNCGAPSPHTRRREQLWDVCMYLCVKQNDSWIQNCVKFYTQLSFDFVMKLFHLKLFVIIYSTSYFILCGRRNLWGSVEILRLTGGRIGKNVLFVLKCGLPHKIPDQRSEIKITTDSTKVRNQNHNRPDQRHKIQFTTTYTKTKFPT